MRIVWIRHTLQYSRHRAGADLMQLKLQRSQRLGGVMGKTVVFCLDVRADYSPEERANINRYKMGSHIIYNNRAAQKHIARADTQAARVRHGGWGDMAAGWALSWTSVAMAKMSLNISIGSLGQGHHIECKDLDELLEAEDTVRNACKGVTRYLEVAATFDGSEVVIEYDRGEEQVRITPNAPPLIAYSANPSASAAPPADAAAGTAPPERPSPQAAYASVSTAGASSDPRSSGEALGRHWMTIENKIVAYAAAKGWNLRRDHIRALGLLTAVLAFILLLAVL